MGLGIELEFQGKEESEIGIIKSVDSTISKGLKVGDTIIKVDKRYYRPAEVETLLGDPRKAQEKLGWKPKYNIEQLCAEMIAEDLKTAKKLSFLKENGHNSPLSFE